MFHKIICNSKNFQLPTTDYNLATIAPAFSRCDYECNRECYYTELHKGNTEFHKEIGSSKNF